MDKKKKTTLSGGGDMYVGSTCYELGFERNFVGNCSCEKEFCYGHFGIHQDPPFADAIRCGDEASVCGGVAAYVHP